MTAFPPPAALAALVTLDLEGIEARAKTARFLLNNIVGPGGLSAEAPVVLLLRQFAEDTTALLAAVRAAHPEASDDAR